LTAPTLLETPVYNIYLHFRNADGICLISDAENTVIIASRRTQPPVLKCSSETEGGSFMHKRTIVVSLMALFFLASISAFGDDVKGMITSRTGETLIVKSGGTTTTVVLTDSTRTKDDRGLFGLEKQEMSNAVLIPGLKVDIDGTSDDQGRFIAKTITVDGDDLEAAEMIQSGLHPTAQQVAANVAALEAHGGQLASHDVQLAAQKENIETNQQNIAAHQQKIEKNIKDIEENTQRFIALSEYDVKGEATVKFNASTTVQ